MRRATQSRPLRENDRGYRCTRNRPGSPTTQRTGQHVRRPGLHSPGAARPRGTRRAAPPLPRPARRRPAHAPAPPGHAARPRRATTPRCGRGSPAPTRSPSSKRCRASPAAPASAAERDHFGSRARTRRSASWSRALTRFNARWRKTVEKLDLRPINELREGYNRYYVIEKACSLALGPAGPPGLRADGAAECEGGAVPPAAATGAALAARRARSRDSPGVIEASQVA